MIAQPEVAVILIDLETERVGVITMHSPVWQDFLVWCAMHNLEPERIPAGSTIVRDAANRCINYSEARVDGNGRPIRNPVGQMVTQDVRMQGQTVPLPFPAGWYQELPPAPDELVTGVGP